MTIQAGVFEEVNQYAKELKETAKYIARRGHGILASDESNGTVSTFYLSLLHNSRKSYPAQEEQKRTKERTD